MSNSIKKLKTKIQKWTKLHLDSFRRYRKLDLLLGVPAVILNGITTSALFVFTDNDCSTPTESFYIIGVISSVSTVLSSLNTYFDFRQRANQHYSLFAVGSNILDQISILGDLSNNNEEQQSALDTILQSLEKLRSIPTSTYIIETKLENQEVNNAPSKISEAETELNIFRQNALRSMLDEKNE